MTSARPESPGAGSSLIFSSYLGGDGYDQGDAIADDGSGGLYLLGHTYSGNFPTVNPYQASLTNNCDIFLTRFDGIQAVTYSTYLGGSSADCGKSITLNGGGRLPDRRVFQLNQLPACQPIPVVESGQLRRHRHPTLLQLHRYYAEHHADTERDADAERDPDPEYHPDAKRNPDNDTSGDTDSETDCDARGDPNSGFHGNPDTVTRPPRDLRL